MKRLVNFADAFLFTPDYGSVFVLKGRIYEYCGIVHTHDDALVIACCRGGKGSYRVLPLSRYKDEKICFIY